MDKLYTYRNPRNGEEAALIAKDVYDIIVQVRSRPSACLRALVAPSTSTSRGRAAPPPLPHANPPLPLPLTSPPPQNAQRLDSEIRYDRDFDYDYFGFKTLERSYLLRIDGKVVERPQHMLMRVAVGIHKVRVEG